MLTLIKWLGGFLLTIAFLILIAIIVVPRVVDPNDYRDDITQLVKDKTGRELSLSGDLSVSVFPWLGVATKGLSLSQPDSIGGDMLMVDNAQLRVKFLPLLSKRLEVDTIVLEQPTVRLITLANGASSMDGLAGEDPETEEAASPEAAIALVVAGVKISNASVLIDDRLEDSRVEIKNLNVNSGNLLGSGMAPLSMQGEMHDPESDGPMLFELDAQARVDQSSADVFMQDVRASVQQGPLNALMDIASLNVKEASLVQLKDLDIEVKGEYPASASIPSLTADLDAEHLDVATLVARMENAQAQIQNLTVRGFEEPKVNAQVSVPAFNARGLLDALEIDYQPVSASALSAVGFSADVAATTDTASFKNLQFDLDQSKLTGSASVRNFEDPAAQFNLDLNNLNIDDYLPPSEEGSEEDEISGAEALAVPLAAFKELNANGRFKAQSLTSGGIKMEDIDVKVVSSAGSVTITPSASLYDGKLDGTIAYTESGDSVLKVQQNVDLVDLGRMLTDADVSEQLRGLGSLAIDVLVRESNGVQTNQGTIKLEASKGEISGVDVNAILGRANNVMALLSSKGNSASESDAQDSGETDKEGITSFADMSGTFNLDNFVITNDDFVLNAPAFAVSGEGVIDVAKQTVNYLIEVAVADNIDGVLGEKLDKIKGQRIPIRCTGALDAPLCLPDAKRLYKNFLSARIDQKKAEFLEEKLGIEDGEKLSTKDVLKGLLINKLDKKEKSSEDQGQGQERAIGERGAAPVSEAQNQDVGEAAETGEQQEVEEEEDPKDALKRKLLEKLFN